MLHLGMEEAQVAATSVQAKHRTVASTPVDSLPARWQWWQGKSLQLPKKEFVNVASFVNCRGCFTAVAQQSFHKQRAFTLSILEEVHPDGGPSSRF